MDKKIYIGACYYPEQWPIERIETDIDLMVEAGINVVRLADLCWATMEPKDGEFDFSIFDKVLAVLWKKGIQAVMCTPTMVPPMWMWKKYPDIFIQAYERKSWDIRSRYCPNNPHYIEYTKRFVKRMADNFKNHPAVIAWQIDNEFNGSPCVCDNCAEAFRQWLKDKYGTLENLNRAWGTVFWSQIYNEWEHVAPPSENEMIVSVSQKVDFLRFTSDSTVKFQRLQADILRATCPDHKLTHNGMGLFDRVNYHELGKDLDFYSWDTYPAVDADNINLCLAHDVSRGVKEKNFWVMEQKNGYFNHAPYNLAIEPGLVRLWSYRDLARGADGVVYFRWRSGRFGLEQHPQGLLKHDGAKRRSYYEVKQLAKEITSISEDLSGSKFQANVAMLWSYDQIWAFETHKQNENFNYKSHFSEYYGALARLGVNSDVINPESDLSKYKLVIAPALFMLNEKIESNLRKYVQEGGTLILTIRTGVRTWSNITVDTPWPGFIHDLVGATVDEFDSMPSNASNSIDYKGRIYKVDTFLEVLKCETAHAEAVYQDKFYKGEAAVTSNKFGKGNVIYCGVMGCKDFFKEYLLDILKGLHIYTQEQTEGIEITYRKGDKQTYMFVLNSSFEDKRVTLDRKYTDIITGRELSGEVNLRKLDVLVLVEYV